MKITRRVLTTKFLKHIKNCAYQRRHLHKLDYVVVDGMSYNVISVTPYHTEDIPKTVNGILKYLINGK